MERRKKLLEQYREMLEQNGVEVPEEPVIPEKPVISENPVVYAVVGTSANPLLIEQQEANAEYIYAYLLNEGWVEKAIFGLSGNIEQESHMNPGTWRKLDDTDAAYGLVQWLDAPSLYEKLRETLIKAFPASQFVGFGILRCEAT